MKEEIVRELKLIIDRSSATPDEKNVIHNSIAQLVDQYRSDKTEIVDAAVGLASDVKAQVSKVKEDAKKKLDDLNLALEKINTARQAVQAELDEVRAVFVKSTEISNDEDSGSTSSATK